MGRARWPPNSFSEWMVGQNFKSTPHRSSSQTRILNVALSEDEVSGDEKIEIIYNGRRVGSRAARQPRVEASTARRVRFDRENRPLKSALKRTAGSGSESDTLVDESSEDHDTSEDESSAVEESDTSEEEAFANRRQKLAAMRRARAAAICKKHDPEGASAIEKNLPHPTCQCTECVRGRKVMETIVQFEAMQEAAKNTIQHEGKKKREGKGKKGKGKKGDDTSTEATSTEAISAETTSAEDSATEDSEASQAEDTEDDNKSTPKQRKKKGSPKENNNKSTPKVNNKKKAPKGNNEPPPKEEKKASPTAIGTPRPVNKDAFKLPTYPKSMEPNLIMPVRSKVLQCEHTIEGPSDPRPNAFMDSGKGIVRVYHGPTWGNHTAELYGRVNPAKVPSPLPPSAGPYPDVHGYPPGPHGPPGPHPPPGPYGPHGPPGYYGPPPYGPYPPYPTYHYPGPPPSIHHGGSPQGQGKPRGTPPAKNMYPPTPNGHDFMNAQIPRFTSPKENASKKVGLTGFAWPETPEMLREARAQEQQEKARPEAANNVGPSQGGAGDQNEFRNSANAWGQANTDGIAQRVDFSTWGNNNAGQERSKSNESSSYGQEGNN